MPRYRQDPRTGKMAGSIGDGATRTPATAPVPPVPPTATTTPAAAPRPSLPIAHHIPGLLQEVLGDISARTYTDLGLADIDEAYQRADYLGLEDIASDFRERRINCEDAGDWDTADLLDRLADYADYAAARVDSHEPTHLPYPTLDQPDTCACPHIPAHHETPADLRATAYDIDLRPWTGNGLDRETAEVALALAEGSQQ